MRLALDVPGDHSVDPRRLVAALATAFERAGGTSAAPASTPSRPTALQLDDGETVSAEQVVLATGASADRAARGGARPGPARQGPDLRLRDPRGPGLVERTIRGLDAYLVPRADGGYVLGATMEERGYDTAPTAGGVYELLRDMSELVPGVLELEIEELRAGLRPATPDNLPAIGPGALDGLVWATGHFRNGIVLAPVTAELVAAVLTGERAARTGRRPPIRAGSRRGARMKVLLNGSEAELADGATVLTAVEALDLPAAGRGVAVAVDAEVVPRTQWQTHELNEGARVEILRAIQGG